MKLRCEKGGHYESEIFLAWLSLSVLLSACATIRGGGDVDQGRQALFEGDYKAALGYFQAAEQPDPNYIYGTELR